jgi:hypothetical protein
VKQYYKVLSTTPEQIFRFYQPTSVLSQGVGSQIPTPPATLESSVTTTTAGGSKPDPESMSAVVKDRFVLPGREGRPLRFEFEHGAIDAQLSVNGGVLLVVTGHLLYLDGSSNNNSNGNNGGIISSGGSPHPKAFVHTFFLGSVTSGGKRSYYVHNDILRFLDDEAVASSSSSEDRTVVASNVSSSGKGGEAAEASQLMPSSVDAKGTATSPPPLSAGKPVLAAMDKLSMDDRDEAPGGGVEESKDSVVEEEDDGATGEALESAEEIAAPEEPASTTVAVGLDEAKFSITSSAAASSKLVPGSWASLVASGGGSASGSTPPTPTRAGGMPVRSAPAIVAAAAATAAVAPTPASKPAPGGSTGGSPAPKAVVPPVLPAAALPQDNPARPAPKHGHARRDPDCTLVVKNIDSDTKESDILGIFEPFAFKTEAKIVGLTVSGHKGIAFVDYDSTAPVLAAVEQHGKEPFQINGRELDIYQKTLEKMIRKASGRGSFRGGGDRGGPGGRRSFGRGGRSERDRGERGGRGGR